MRRIECDSIIFDMDGVLISNDSYNLATIRTVEYFLSESEGTEVEVTTDEISAIKKIAGFNNDWDMSYALVYLLKRRIMLSNFKKQITKITPIIRRSVRYKTIKDIFQSYYLGKQLFQNIYKRQPPISNEKGLIEKEEILLEKKILESLMKKYKLAIATSRPRFEALFAARIQKISPTFIKEEYIVAKEDVKREKPSPDPLLEAKKRIKGKKSVYIGDTINDIIAAKKAGMLSIFIGKENLGDYQVSDVNKLKEVLL